VNFKMETSIGIQDKLILFLLLSLQMAQVNPVSNDSAHEQEPTDLECGISIKGLEKTFKVVLFVLLEHIKMYVMNL